MALLSHRVYSIPKEFELLCMFMVLNHDYYGIITFCVYSLGKEIMGDTFTGTNYHDVRIKP